MPEQKHILIVDDDRALRTALAATLEAGGAFRVTEAGTAAEAMALAVSRDQRFDAILLDLNLPDGDGCDVCTQLRRNGVRVPVVMLTAAMEEEDVVRSLDAGANDYVMKPFRVAELIARLRAQIRAHETSEDAVLIVGPYHFRPGSRSLFDPAENKRIRLTEKETLVLKYLYRAAGKPVGRQVLLREVWGYATGASTHTVETHIYRLRRKIEADDSIARILVNEEGGYRLSHDRRPSIALSLRPRVAMEMMHT
jgi:DNA-binding response OmpR family regulator